MDAEEAERILDERFVRKDQLIALAEEVAGFEMVLTAFIEAHPDLTGLHGRLAGMVRALKPEYRSSGSARVLFKMSAVIDSLLQRRNDPAAPPKPAGLQ